MQRKAFLMLAGGVLLATAAATGCELIAGPDRDLIPSSGGGTATGGGGEADGGGGSGGAPECTGADDCGTSTTCHLFACDDGTCSASDAATATPCSENNGQICDGNGSCVECVDNTQCAGTDLCDLRNHICVPEPCQNGAQDGEETDTDCGGPVCGDCINGDSCAAFGDCQSAFCNVDTCAPCGGEGDCQSSDYCDDALAGGSCVPKKPDGDACGGGDEECQNGHCVDDFCCDTVCDGTCASCDQQNVEGTCTAIPVGTDPDLECAPDVCGGSVCRCDNNAQDGAETDIDCGGGACATCANGDSCVDDGDCTSGNCLGTTCADPTCGDGLLNGDDECDGDGAGTPGETPACDDDCTLAKCNDGHVNGAAGETCDDSGTAPNDGCDASCHTEMGWLCSTEPSICVPVCGDGLVVGSEACDDDFNVPGDGCSATCTEELGWDCTGEPSDCDPICGDGLVLGGEECDDDFNLPNDGCSPTCIEEAGWDCSGAPSACAPICGDGLILGGEECDDDFLVDGDGCSALCIEESGWDCSGAPSTCVTMCSDGVVAGAETCDDDNGSNNDDCPDGLGGTCVAATCNDGFLHDAGTGDESDIDCGGSCPGCDNGEDCIDGGDCLSGVCVGTDCAAPAVVSTTPADGAGNVSVASSIPVTFNGAMAPATLTAKATLDDETCTGNVQVSTDGFATCIPIGMAVMSSGNSVATFIAAPGLSFGSSYRVRVTTGAQSSTGAALASPYTSTTGFTTSTDPHGTVVVSQIYGGGGAAMTGYKNDLIELHNRGNTAVDVTGWTVQFANGPMANWAATTLAGSIPAGGYYLILEAGGAMGVDLPTPDISGSLVLGQNAGKVALVMDGTILSGTCPRSGNIVDFVGYGTMASCNEGGSNTPSPSATNAVIRPGTSCADTNVNGSDFVSAAAVPYARSSATAAVTCSAHSTQNETGVGLEIDYCNVQDPTSLTIAATTPQTFYGRVYEAGITDVSGPTSSITVQFGYGPRTVNPEWQPGYTFFNATYNTSYPPNDYEYMVTTAAPAAGTYGYVFRMSLDSGATWTYCDVFGAGSNLGLTFEVPHVALMTTN